MNYNKAVSALCLLSVVSCGGGKSNTGNKSSFKPNNSGEEQETVMVSEGTYKAILRPYNFNVSGWVPNGVTDIKVLGDELEVGSWLDDSGAVTHMQNIHAGTVCPGPEHDLNKDGYVDFKESQNVSGEILIPLDSDLNSHLAGANMFPKGNFTYFQKASMDDLLEDLRKKNLSKKSFNLEGKVIIVMGAVNKALPASIAPVNGLSRELSIPIACGVIQRKADIVQN